MLPVMAQTGSGSVEEIRLESCRDAGWQITVLSRGHYPDISVIPVP